MATQNFKVKNGITVGDNDLIDASGNIVIPTGSTVTLANGNTVEEYTDQAEEDAIAAGVAMAIALG